MSGTTRNQAGFSLLEISISLIIIGLIGGFGLSALTAHYQNKSIQITKENQENAMKMLAVYVMKTGGLPKPSGATLTGEQRGFQGGAHEEQGIAIGILPYKTLGIPEKVAKDGWNRYFTYAMSSNLFHHPSTLTRHHGPGQKLDHYLSQHTSPIQIMNQDHHPLTRKTDLVAAVLVSHGKLGFGAFDKNGQRQMNQVKKSALEEINADTTATFIDAPHSIEAHAYFDDMVIWATRDSLLTVYGNAPHLIAPR